ncbi:MAG: hypothetical protein U1D26_03970 [Patescibacteria group bacterium]|nr:hypothetical protein [bacterium]MDZ4227606.1 hypothetical protein [Patescibacteria group bacterium]
MGSIEEKGRQRARRRNIRRALLGVAKTGALIGVAVTAPKVISALHKLGVADFDINDAGVVTRARRHLFRSGLLTTNEKGLVRLTPKGKKELERIEARERLQEKPRSWDGRWRVLIFDIPEHRRSLRVRLRRTLLSVGFMRLQDSVWIYPYDCEDFIVLLKADFKVGKDVLYMIVDELEGDARMRENFGLRER